MVNRNNLVDVVTTVNFTLLCDSIDGFQIGPFALQRDLPIKSSINL